MPMEAEKRNSTASVRILTRKLIIIPRNQTGIQWLIGSPFFPPFTIVSTFRCIHTIPNSSSSPDYEKESDDIQRLLLKGFNVIGALIVAGGDSDPEKAACEAIDVARKLREFLFVGGKLENGEMIGAVAGHDAGDIRYFVSRSGDSKSIEVVDSVVHEDQPEEYIWERGCLLRCQLPISLPLFVPVKKPSG